MCNLHTEMVGSRIEEPDLFYSQQASQTTALAATDRKAPGMGFQRR
jgi:hypothetical protein